MTSTYEFWMGWIAQVLIAVGTIAAVFVALFGGWLRGRLAPPKLVLMLINAVGVKTPVQLAAPDGSTRKALGRWYHLRVSNKRRWSPATQVQVFLLSVEEPDASGEFKVKWIGEIPIRWRDQEIKPLTRTIGHAEDIDLCSVVETKWLELHPLIVPYALDAKRRTACRLFVTLQARSIEADSDLLRVAISWNGKWADDEKEMAQHMVVKLASDT